MNFIKSIIIFLFLQNFLTAQDISFQVSELQINYPGSNLIVPTSLNDSGIIAGRMRVEGNSYDLNFIYDYNDVSPIPILSGYDQAGYSAINNNRVVGGTNNSFTETEPRVQGFIYKNNQLTGIGTLGGNHSVITGINDAGILCGYSALTGDNYYHAVIYEDGVLKDLGTVAHNYSRAFKINNINSVVGWSNVIPGENNIFHAFIHRNNTMTGLGTLPGHTFSEAWGINDSDFVVGFSRNTDGTGAAFIWYGEGSLVQLPSVAGTYIAYAEVINNNNMVIGTCNVINGGQVPVIWIDGEVYPINNLVEQGSGYEIKDLYAINNRNQILCQADLSGQQKWVILNPKSEGFVVNLSSDENDFDLDDDVCDVDPVTPGDQCTLRAAIEQSNHNSGKDKISFNIQAGGTPSINIESPLPPITDEIEIDGFSK